MSRDYILLSTLSKKRRFRRFKNKKVLETTRFFPFLYIPGGLEGLSDVSDSLHHHTPGRELPPPLVGAPSSSGVARTVSTVPAKKIALPKKNAPLFKQLPGPMRLQFFTFG